MSAQICCDVCAAVAEDAFVVPGSNGRLAIDAPPSWSTSTVEGLVQHLCPGCVAAFNEWCATRQQPAAPAGRKKPAKRPAPSTAAKS